VVVANIQVKTLKTEVGKGFSRTVIVRELVDPKLQCNIVKTDYTRLGVAPPGVVSVVAFHLVLTMKGNLVNILEPWASDKMVMSSVSNRETVADTPGRVIFSVYARYRSPESDACQ